MLESSDPPWMFAFYVNCVISCLNQRLEGCTLSRSGRSHDPNAHSFRLLGSPMPKSLQSNEQMLSRTWQFRGSGTREDVDEGSWRPEQCRTIQEWGIP